MSYENISSYCCLIIVIYVKYIFNLKSHWTLFGIMLRHIAYFNTHRLNYVNMLSSCSMRMTLLPCQKTFCHNETHFWKLISWKREWWKYRSMMFSLNLFWVQPINWQNGNNLIEHKVQKYFQRFRIGNENLWFQEFISVNLVTTKRYCQNTGRV